MTVKYTRVGTNADGSPHFRVESDDPTKRLVYTGPYIFGPVTLPDGTVYDVSPVIIEVDAGHELLVSDAIGARHQADGHPLHDDDQPFVHTPSAVTHDADGAPSEVFADLVHEHAAPERDSSPAAVLAAALAQQEN